MEQMTYKKKHYFVEYFLLIFIILWSGGSFTYGLFDRWPYVMFLVSAYFLIRRHQRIEDYNIKVIGLFFIVLVFQALYFNGSITTIVAPTLRLFTIAMIAIILRPHFNRIFINIITFFALISLLFWFIDMSPIGHAFLLNLAMSLPQFGGNLLAEVEQGAWGNNHYTVYFYTVSVESITSQYYSWVRNSGPFFEPGRFTIFLSIALALLLYNNNYRRHRKSFYVLMAANITTFSTTGYFVMILLFFTFYLGHGKYANVKNFTMFIIVFILAYFVMQTSFMGEKVSIALGDTDNANSRFGAVLYHWTQIVKSPLLGYGVFLNKIYNELEMSPCGITLMMRQWGIPLFLICIWLAYKGSRVYLLNNMFLRLSFVFILLLLSYTQSVMDNPMYYLFYLIGSKKYYYGEQF